MRDRELAIALDMHDREVHGPCGHPVSEAMDPDGPDYTIEDAQCRACALLEDAQSEHDEPGTVRWVERR